MARTHWAAILLAQVVCFSARAQAQTDSLQNSKLPLSRASSVPSRPQPKVYDLQFCLRSAAANYPKINEARARLRQKRSQLTQAQTAPFSKFSATGALGPAPTTRGTNVYSPDSDASLSSDMGLFWQVGVEGTIPLWTFGKITSLIDAAEAQVVVGKHEVDKEQNAALLQVRTAYYGVQLARDSRALIDEAKQRIDKYLPRLEKSVETGDGDDIELLRMKMYRADLDARFAEAQREERKALVGLKFLTGIEGAFDIPDAPLLRVTARLLPLSRYLEVARLFRPEINMARAGIVARKAQWELERARSYPDLGLGVRVKWARAPQVTDQRNPFVGDEANGMQYGAALGLKWDLDFLPQAAKSDEARAKLEETEATERFALGGVATEVEQAFLDAQAAEQRLEAAAAALHYSKQWLVKVQQAIDIGTMDNQDIVDPSKEYALRRFSELTAIFDYNTAIARLAQASGWRAILNEQ